VNAGRPFKVLIDGRKRAQLWAYYETSEQAAESARRLRVLGMHARAVPADDDDRPDARRSVPAGNRRTP